MNTQEKYWEFEKLFNEKEVIWFKYLYDIEELYSDESGILLKRFKNLDDWQKDLLLATFQNVDPISIEPDEHGSKFLKNYELRNKEQYEKDKYIKNRLMLMLKNGAKINKYFLNIKRKQTKKYRIIDRLEELYNICKKPIIASCSDEDGMTQNKGNHYLLENNSKNRFLNKYYFQLSKYFGEDYYSSGNYDDVEELYKFFMKYDSIPEKLKIELAKKYCENQKYNIDYQQEERFLKAELLSHTKHIFETYDRFKEKEKKIQDSLKELKRLEELLNSGQKEYTVDEYDEIGGKDYVDIRNYIIFWKSSITYAEFLKHRDNRLTDDLIKNIDNLSIQEIREKYFKIEVEDND